MYKTAEVVVPIKWYSSLSRSARWLSFDLVLTQNLASTMLLLLAWLPGDDGDGSGGGSGGGGGGGCSRIGGGAREFICTLFALHHHWWNSNFAWKLLLDVVRAFVLNKLAYKSIAIMLGHKISKQHSFSIVYIANNRLVSILIQLIVIFNWCSSTVMN